MMTPLTIFVLEVGTLVVLASIAFLFSFAFSTADLIRAFSTADLIRSSSTASNIRASSIASCSGEVEIEDEDDSGDDSVE
jgi:hypothetical protein